MATQGKTTQTRTRVSAVQYTDAQVQVLCQEIQTLRQEVREAEDRRIRTKLVIHVPGIIIGAVVVWTLTATHIDPLASIFIGSVPNGVIECIDRRLRV